MLRRQKLRPYERALLSCFGVLLLGAGLTGAFLGFEAGQWRFVAAGVATIGLAGVYFRRREDYQVWTLQYQTHIPGPSH